MIKTKIEWTETSWNPITGCTKISDGCKNCYAERMAKRLKAMNNQRYTNGFELTVHEDLFEKPLKVKKPHMIFVNSMSDMFHEDLDLEYIKQIFNTMNEASHHTFQILTKRADRMLELAEELTWGDNIWMGVTVESKKYIERIDKLKKVPAHMKFISFEPLLDSVGPVNFEGIDWVIVGGESGPKSRAIEASWVRNIRDICVKSNTPFFFKQWGCFNKKKNGRDLDGKVYNEMPKIKFEK